MNPFRFLAPVDPEFQRLTKVFVVITLVALAILVLFANVAACNSPQQAKTATNFAVKVADDTCKEVANTPADLPDWVDLACTAEGVASGVVHVLMPKQQWHDVRLATKAGRRDAGPGL